VLETSGLFVWIGAKPHTDWLSDSIARDEDGFILTGQDLLEREIEGSWDGRGPMPLESSMPGVFVAGDARYASVKRIGSAVGEGSMAVQFIHQFLRDR
jgi:thioredoxin reductase (NADPH)